MIIINTILFRFFRYSDDNKLLTLYSNFAAFSEHNHLNTVNGQFLAYHRAELGLHFHNKIGKSVEGKLIQRWHNFFTEWPEKVNIYHFNGRKVGELLLKLF